ncbi:MAG: DnaJ domain-containing protein [Candidatus Limnocylindrales bacterium]
MQALPDPYRVLGLPREATLHEIKAAHRRLAKRYHPDATSGDTLRFLAVQEAYLTLSDPLKRREWDARHQPGPVRANGGTAAGSRGGPRRATGREGGAERGTTTARGAAPGRGTASGAAQAGRAHPDAGDGGSGAAGRARPTQGASKRRRPEPWSTSGRDPHADSYTWSAGNVPWWEEGGASSGRRQPGRRRPAAAGEASASGWAAPGSSGPGADRGSAGWPPRNGWGAEPGPDEEPTGAAAGTKRSAGTAGRGPARPTAGGATGSGSSSSGPTSGPGSAAGSGATPGADFDVYSRSSGAAWSMASRAFFRRADADLPRGAAEPFGHRWTSPDGGDARAAEAGRRASAAGQGTGSRPSGSGAGAPREDGPAPRSAGAQERASSAGRAPGGGASSAGNARPPGTGQGAGTGRGAGTAYAAGTGRSTGTAYAAGTAFAGGTVPPAAGLGTVRPGGTTPADAFAAVRDRFGATPGWPRVRDRVLYATLAWLPPLVFLAGPTPGAVSPVRTLALGGLLLVFALLPRLAYVAAVGGAAALVAGAAILLAQTLLEVGAPGPLDVVAPLALLLAYGGAALLALRDWPLARPWTTS